MVEKFRKFLASKIFMGLFGFLPPPKIGANIRYEALYLRVLYVV
jgi:hypothetical protein